LPPTVGTADGARPGGDIVRHEATEPATEARVNPARSFFMPDLRFRFECPLAWDDLTGDDRARFCSTCRTTVTNLSALSSAEAEVFLRSRQGRVCVRVEHDRSGRVRHWPDLRAAALATALAACAPGSDDSGAAGSVADAVATADVTVATPAGNRLADVSGVATTVRGGSDFDAAASDPSAGASATPANRLADAPNKNGHAQHLALAATTNAAGEPREWLQTIGYLE